MNILITGGSRGIGRETALCLAKDKKNKILITGRNEAALMKVAGDAKNRNIFYYIIDFSILNTMADLLNEHVASLFSTVDIVINNAGSIVNKKFVDLSNDDFRSMMETNYYAPAIIIRTMLPLMRRGGHIVNITSMGGFQGSVKFTGLSGYSSSKAALACLTECLAIEFKEKGIAVNCLALGSVQTEMLEEAFPGYKAAVTSAEMGEFIAKFALNGHRYFNGKILPVAVTTP